MLTAGSPALVSSDSGESNPHAISVCAALRSRDAPLVLSIVSGCSTELLRLTTSRYLRERLCNERCDAGRFRYANCCTSRAAMFRTYCLSRRYVFTLALLTSTYALSRYPFAGETDVLLQPLTTIPAEMAGWRLRSTDQLDENVVSMLAATSLLARTYQRGDDRLSVFVAWYGSQSSGAGFHSPTNCLPGNGWMIRKAETVDVPVDGERIGIRSYLIRNDDTDLTVLYWYQSGTRIVTNEYVGRLLLFRDALLDGRRSGSLVRVVAGPDPNQVRDAIGFASELIRRLRICFGSAPAATQAS